MPNVTIIRFDFPNSSYFGRFSAQSGTDHIACRCTELVNVGADFPAVDRDRDIWSGTYGPLLLENMEKFGHHGVRHSWLLLWFICKHNGFVKSTASNNVNTGAHLCV